MYRWILLSSLLLALCSAKCKKGDIIFTGDGKSFWIAEVGEESVPQLLAPVKKATFLNRNTRILEVIIKPACGEVKLMKISVDTRNIQEIQVLGKKQSLPSRSFEWRKTSITFMEEVVDQIVIKVRTEDYEAAIRSIFVKACLVRGNTAIDQIFTVLLSTSTFVGGAVAFILDNTVPGTDEERGLTTWHKHILSPRDANRSIDTCYDLPFCMPRIRNWSWTKYVPLCPTFTGWNCRKSKYDVEKQHKGAENVRESLTGETEGEVSTNV